MSTLTKPKKHAAAQGPGARLDFLWLELTQKCNLTCTHCYVSSSPGLALHDKMRHEDWIASIDQAADLGCKAIQFIGGEPLLYPMLDDLIEHSRSKEFSLIEVFTNGTAVNDKRASFFAKFGVNVACSFYSADAKTHDAVTGKVGSFEMTVGGLRNLKRHAVPVRIGFIEMARNEGHFDDARRLLESIGIDSVSHDSMRAFGRAGASVRETPAQTKFAGLCGQCCKNKLCLTYTGELYPCPMSRAFPVGSFFNGGLGATVAGDALETFQTEMEAEFWVVGICKPDICLPGGDCPPGPPWCKPDNPCKPAPCAI